MTIVCITNLFKIYNGQYQNNKQVVTLRRLFFIQTKDFKKRTKSNNLTAKEYTGPQRFDGSATLQHTKFEQQKLLVYVPIKKQ